MKRRSSPQSGLSNIPSQPTPFIGRAEEIGEVGTLLADSTCRLLTLAGPGGIGKTRLAVEAAAKKLKDFPHGVYFVPLQPVSTSNLLVQGIADAVHFSLAGSETPRVQLLNYLHDKEMLLVLDNFEQLLPRSASSTHEEHEHGLNLLRDILHSTADVKLLVTSREVLNLQSEWVYSVEGMMYPRSAQVEAIEDYSAVQLFRQRARRVRKGFALADERDEVVRICQLVEGMPLALELAASWITTLGCAEIAAELQSNLNFLATSLRDVPNRHRNMQAVFDHSWKLLTPEEREVFQRLSVFRGGFQRLAAERVTGATLPILSALVDKSLLRRDPEGRYQVHELLRQYGEEQLEQPSEKYNHAHNLHCACFADFLHDRLEEVHEGRQREATLDIAAELENVRAAWGWAVEHAKVEEIHEALGALLYLCQYQSRYLEGAVAFEEAARSLERLDPGALRDLTLAELLDYQGWLSLRLGQLDTAKEVLERSLAIYQCLDVPPAERMGTDPRTALGVLAVILGDYAEAARLGEEAYQAGEKQANKWNMTFSLYVLTSAALALGEVRAARRYAQQAYALANEVNDSWFRAFILTDLGNAVLAMDEYAEAQGYFQASYTIRKEFDDPGGMAVALNHLGKVAVLREDYAGASQLYQESLSIYKEINDKGGLATALDGLGVTACAIGDYQAAGEHFDEALQVATEMQFLPLTLSILVNVGELCLHAGEGERGVELLATALHHPASAREAKERAGQLLTRLHAQIQPDLFMAAQQRGQASTIEDALVSLLSASVVPGKRAVVSPLAAQRHIQPSDQALVEPLTPRELDVLRLIAAGLSNKAIAEKLVITPGTVKWYNNRIYSKLNVRSRTQAIARAGELKLLF